MQVALDELIWELEISSPDLALISLTFITILYQTTLFNWVDALFHFAPKWIPLHIPSPCAPITALPNLSQTAQ